jgi:hypothetical protein
MLIGRVIPKELCFLLIYIVLFCNFLLRIIIRSLDFILTLFRGIVYSYDPI